MDYLSYTFFENTVETWLTALGIFVLSFILLRVIRALVARRIASWAAKTETDLDDLFVALLDQTKTWFLLLLSLYIGSQVLTLPDNFGQTSKTITVVAFFVQVAFWGNGAITYWIASQVRVRSGEDAEGATTMNILGYVAKVVLWSIMLLLALDNIPGVEVDSLIASLGIGGVAVALAIQNILGDLFASLSIALDEPFVIGDFVIIGDYSGTVERIGLNTTRIRSLYGEQLVFSNSDLIKSRIKNYKSMTRRRVQFGFGVVYQTPYAKLKEIPAMVQEIIESRENVTFDRAHFKEFGDFALVFEVVFYVEGPDYNQYMDIQQAINFAITEKFEEENIEMAYPTQTVYLEKPA